MNSNNTPMITYETPIKPQSTKNNTNDTGKCTPLKLSEYFM